MLSSLAVTAATIDFFTFSQVSFGHTGVLHSVNLFCMPLLYSATLYHLTIIAWERYVAVEKWIDYKLIITNGRPSNSTIDTYDLTEK